MTTADGTRLFYTDWGTGRPVVLIHGWPLSLAFWKYQATALAEAGYRVVAYDRRGFGRSDHPWDGYDTLTDDLAQLLDALDLHEVTLVGFSMGGGEVARYPSRHGRGRVSQAVLIAAVTPYLLHTADNPASVILHGQADENVPAAATGRAAAAMVPRSRYIEFPGAQHAVIIDSADAVNHELLAFRSDEVGDGGPASTKSGIATSRR